MCVFFKMNRVEWVENSLSFHMIVTIATDSMKHYYVDFIFYSSESSKHKCMCKREEKPNEVEDKERKKKTKNKELFIFFVVLILF